MHQHAVLQAPVHGALALAVAVHDLLAAAVDAGLRVAEVEQRSGRFATGELQADPEELRAVVLAASAEALAVEALAVDGLEQEALAVDLRGHSQQRRRALAALHGTHEVARRVLAATTHEAVRLLAFALSDVVDAPLSTMQQVPSLRPGFVAARRPRRALLASAYALQARRLGVALQERHQAASEAFPPRSQDPQRVDVASAEALRTETAHVRGVLQPERRTHAALLLCNDNA
eukprot:scaffold1744_cov252-Pinguiococcus_pyrenoidosus.AAC.5